MVAFIAAFRRKRTWVTPLRGYTSSVSLRLPPSPQGEGFAALNDNLSPHAHSDLSN